MSADTPDTTEETEGGEPRRATPAAIAQLPFSLPAGCAQVVFVRHGASEPAYEDQPFDHIDGQGDPALAPEGRIQALAVGNRLTREIPEPAAVYVSTMRRTQETAQPYLDALGLTAIVDADLREVHLGEWELGSFRHKVAAGDPIATKVFTEQRWDAIPGGEPQEQFAARARGVVARIAHAHIGQTVVAFSHGAFIAEVAHQATGSRPFAFVGAENTGVSRFIVGPFTEDGQPTFIRLRSFSDTSHLG